MIIVMVIRYDYHNIYDLWLLWWLSGTITMLFKIDDYCDGYQVDRPSPGCPGWREEFRRLAVRVPAVQVRSVFLVQVF